MKIIGFSGAHRVGKSTLAKALVEQMYGFTYLETSASKTFARLGLDPKADYPIEKRLEIQNEILTDMSQLFDKATHFSIADRTPLDMAAYMLADVSREAVRTPELDEAIMKYVARCRTLIQRHFACLFVVQPGIPIVEEAGKAPGVRSYMEHCNALVVGLMMGTTASAIGVIMTRGTTDLQARVDYCKEVISQLPNSPYWVDVQQGAVS